MQQLKHIYDLLKNDFDQIDDTQLEDNFSGLFVTTATESGNVVDGGREGLVEKFTH